MRLKILDSQLLQHRVLVAFLALFVIAGEAQAASWMPWGDAPLAKARREDKPVLLAVSDRNCYRCALAETSDPAVVPVILDRDLHPRVAEAFRQYVRETSQRKDFPLYLLLTPDAEPLATAAAGETLTAFLARILPGWKSDRPALLGEAGLALRRRRLSLESAPIPPIEDTPLTRALRAKALIASGDESKRQQGLGLLHALARSPLYDVLGGGFFHHARDAVWSMPQFEKRLEDQAGIAMIYTDAWKIGADPVFMEVAQSTLQSIVREFRDRTSGLFWNALGADSLVPRGAPRIVEGGHYVWEASEIRNLLGERSGDIFLFHYGAAAEGNVASELDKAGELRGRNILFPSHSVAETSLKFKIGAAELEEILSRARAALAEVRFNRPPPSLDDRLFTAANGLAISALARGGVAFDNSLLSSAALQAARSLGRARGALTRMPGAAATVDDYALLIRGVLDAYETSFDAAFLEDAIRLQKKQDELFWIATAGDYRREPVPPPVAWLITKDDGLRSVTAGNLARLAEVAGLDSWRDRAASLDPSSVPIRQVIIAGAGGADDTRAILAAARKQAGPRQMIFLVDSKTSRQKLGALMPYIKNIVPIEKKTAVAICIQRSCSSPTTETARE